jgi:hypothetical protein
VADPVGCDPVTGDKLAFPNVLMPEFDVESRHAVRISASAESVYRQAREIDLSSSLLIRMLFRLRGLPTSALTIDGLSRLRFKVLEESPPHRFALGIIGQFWTLSGNLVDFDPAAFASFDEPGYARAVWTFEVSEDAYGATTLKTVTRVQCTDEASRRGFLRYWGWVGPFSGLIRTRMLVLIRTAAESRRARRE